MAMRARDAITDTRLMKQSLTVLTGVILASSWRARLRIEAGIIANAWRRRAADAR